MKRVLFFCVGLLVACSQHQPGPYEGGGRTFPPILIDGTSSGAAPDGEECMLNSDCCSGACNLEALEPVCYTPTDASTPPVRDD